jgi:ATP-dependent exoDNAse (exonuclease V) alpha subunit
VIFSPADARLAGETVTGKSALQDGTAFIPGGTLIVDQAEKLSLKETISLLDGAMRHNVQVLLSDSGKRSGTGSALTVLKESGVNTYRWQGGKQATADIISEPEKGALQPPGAGVCRQRTRRAGKRGANQRDA